MQKLLRSSVYTLLIWISTLQAEVEEIIIRWNAILCLETCIPRLEENLKAIKHINNLQINSRSGTAVMGWNPNETFTYPPFRLASAAVGIHFSDIRLRVRGTITHDVDNYYLISTGDGGRFLIIGPLLVEPGRYTPNNIITHPLTAQMKFQLDDAEQKKQTVTISGPLFFPSHYPRTIIAEQIKISQVSQMDPRNNR